MPPRIKKTTAALSLEGPVSIGAGITAGLEIWRYGAQFVLVDRSSDGRFADDVRSWNTAAGLNEATCKYIKDATQ